MQTVTYGVLVLAGIVGPKLVSKVLKRPVSPLVLGVYAASFFVAAFGLLWVVSGAPYPLELAAVSGLCAMTSTGVLVLEQRGKG